MIFAVASMNPFLQKVLRAEEEAAQLIVDAKENRVLKMASAQEEAEQAAKEARRQEEELLQKLIHEKFGDAEAGLAKLEELSKQEIALVKKDFKAHREAVQDYLVARSLNVKLQLENVQKRYLRAAAQGRVKGYI